MKRLPPLFSAILCSPRSFPPGWGLLLSLPYGPILLRHLHLPSTHWSPSRLGPYFFRFCTLSKVNLSHGIGLSYHPSARGSLACLQSRPLLCSLELYYQWCAWSPHFAASKLQLNIFKVEFTAFTLNLVLSHCSLSGCIERLCFHPHKLESWGGSLPPSETLIQLITKSLLI